MSAAAAASSSGSVMEASTRAQAGAATRAPIRCPTWLPPVVLLLLVAAVYWPALGFGYVQFDDPDYVTKNAHVRAGLTVEGVRWAFTAREAANWHPLTWFSLMLDTSLMGDRAWGHHAVSIALHGVNVLLLYSTLRLMTAAPWRSFMTAALLAAHPLHVESVAWISERKDVLSMLFGLLAVRAYWGYASATATSTSAPRESRRLRTYGFVAMWMALSLMSKPMLVTLPGLLVLLDLWPLDRNAAPAFGAAWWRRLAVLACEKLPLLALSVASAVLTVWAQLAQGEIREGILLTLPQRLQNVAVGYVMYLGKLFWPVDLACLYPNPLHLGDWSWPPWQPLAAAGVLAAFTLGTLVAIRRAPQLMVGWLWFVIAMVPVIGFVQIGRQIIADRYAYIPFIGLYIVLAWMLGALALRMKSPILIRIVCGLIVTSLAAQAHRHVYVWRDSVTLFRHAQESTERNWLMLNNLAGVLENESRREEALTLLEQAVKICATCAWVHQHRGEMLARANQLFDAQLALERAIELDPNLALAHANLGVVLAQRSRPSEGIVHLRRAVELQPSNPEWRVRLAAALGVAGLFNEAVEHVEKAMTLQPARRSEWQPMLDALRSNAAPAAATEPTRP